MTTNVLERLVLDELEEDSKSDESSCSSCTTDSTDGEAVINIAFSALRNEPRKCTFDDKLLSYTDKKFMNHFRITRTLYDQLVVMFSESEEYLKIDRRKVYTPKTQFATFLFFAGHAKCSYRDVSVKFGLPLGSVSLVLFRVLTFLSKLSEMVIQWPAEEEKTKTRDVMKSKTGLQGVIGIIDCTRVRIDLPKNHRQKVYLEKKKVSSLCLQGICNENMKFIDISVGIPGPVKDNKVFEKSFIFRRLPSLCRSDEFLLGDTAYICSPYLISPYRDDGNLSPKQKFFNQKLNAGRTTVDHAFRLLTRRFGQLKHCKLRGIGKICHFIRACVVLHNLSKNDEFPLDIDEDEEIEENDCPSTEQEQGSSLRDRLCEEVCTYFDSNIN